MSDYSVNSKADLDDHETKVRSVGETEHSWCKAVSCGTGVTVLAIAGSKQVPNTDLLQNALHKIQNSHPILRSKIRCNTTSFSFATPASSDLQIQKFPLSSTLDLLSNPDIASLSPLHAILEHEMNDDTWRNIPPCNAVDVFFASLYEVPEEKWVLALRLHTAACDRTTAVSLLRELKGLMKEGGGDTMGSKRKDGVSLGIESMIPSGKSKKKVWAHGLDMLSYSVNSVGLTNLKFRNVKGRRCSQVVRLQMSAHDTHQILSGCESRGIKLCGALAAAGLIAAHSSRFRPSDRQKSTKKYGVVTLTDCRSILDPPLYFHNFGFYHSAIVNAHAMKEGEELWELAERSYKSFENSKKLNKHFSDMSDLNFLMCKAIDNPKLTPSSSLRTSLVSVFEDMAIIDGREKEEGLVVEDYMGCASAHGVGPSIAIFDTIRDGGLDCVCVYPSPLHSRDQMEEFVGDMKRILVEGITRKCMQY